MTEIFIEIDFFVLMVFSIMVWLTGFYVGRMSNE